MIEGYIRFNKLFLRVQDQHKKITIYKEKKIILEQVNGQIANVGFAHPIQDILFK